MKRKALFMLNGIRRIYSLLKPPKQMSTSDSIFFYNWWDYDCAEDEWLARFLKCNFPEYEKYNLSFVSVFGPIRNISRISGRKIFYTGEAVSEFNRYDELQVNEHGEVYRLHNQWLQEYGTDMQEKCDLSLGFSRRHDSRYLRFPIWMLRCFSPQLDYKIIKGKIDDINERNNSDRALRECVLVASHDDFGSREYIFNLVQDILTITSVGKWKHNSDELWEKYPVRDKIGLGKIEFMKDFKFNICPENMDIPDYCTEKIFDSFQAGTIPIYHGAINNPEPDIINHNAVIFVDYEKDNSEVVKLISELNKDDDLLRKFMAQNRFTDDAAEIIYGMMLDLKEHVKVLLE